MRNGADPIKVVSGHPPPWPEEHGFKAFSHTRAGVPPQQVLQEPGKPEEMGQLRKDSQNRNNQRPYHPHLQGGLGWGRRGFPASLWNTGKEVRVQAPVLATPHLCIPVPSQGAQGIYSAGRTGELRHRAALQLQRPTLPAQPPASSLAINYHASHKHVGTTLHPTVPGSPAICRHILSRK